MVGSATDVSPGGEGVSRRNGVNSPGDCPAWTVDGLGEESRVLDRGGGGDLGDGFHSSCESGGCRDGHWACSGISPRRSAHKGPHRQDQFRGFSFHGKYDQYGGGLAGDRRGQGSRRRHLRLYRPDADLHVPFYAGLILDRLCRTSDTGVRNRNDLDHHACTHGICDKPWLQPAGYRNALDIRRGRPTVHIPITCSDCWLLVRLL